MSTNVKWHDTRVKRAERVKSFGHESKVLWFTGLSGSGKSTIAVELEHNLHSQGIPTYLLDGDNVRHGLNKDLDFSPEDREENIRRISEVAKLFYDAGITVLVSFISPYKKDRELARQLVRDDFIEVYVKCDLDICAKRDPKGLYKKAKTGEIKEFTGISAPYEEPENPEIIVDTGVLAVDESVEKIVSIVAPKG